MSLYCFASRRVNACYKCLLCMHAPNATILFVYIGNLVIIGTFAIIVVLIITMILPVFSDNIIIVLPKKKETLCR